jgi:hypothetical protein
VDRDYASHLPVLKAILGSVRPGCVLEFGAGLHSTPAFLERKDLTRVVSVEPDAKWRRKVALYCDDDRLVLRPDKNVVPECFDLVFIDDGQEVADREQTIRFVLGRRFHPPTVIHDADVPEYLQAIEELAINYSIFPTDPATAVVWL